MCLRGFSCNCFFDHEIHEPHAPLEIFAFNFRVFRGQVFLFFIFPIS